MHAIRRSEIIPRELRARKSEDIMSYTALKPADLAAYKRKLRALQVIKPPHPDDAKKQLRVGMDPRGHYWRFVFTSKGWIKFKPCKDEEIAEIFAFYGEEKPDCILEHRRGPSGCEMLYHIEEPP
jgi:hypothetical protein